MTDLYVSTNGSDSNAGTQASPFKTISHAADSAKAGTTVHVAPGTYQGGFKTTANGVTYVSDQKWGAKIVTKGSPDMAWDNRGDNVTINGFEVDGSGSSTRIGLYTAGSNSVIENSKVHDLAHDPSKANDDGGGAGVYGDGYYGDTNITLRGNEIYNIGPAGQNSSLIHGIYHSTTGTIAKNFVHDNAGVGIHLWHDARSLTIDDNTSVKNNMGIWVGGGDNYRYSGSADHVKVVSNDVYDNRTYGVAEGGNTGTHNSYTGNSVHDNGTDWHLQNGLKAAAAADVTPEHLALLQQAAATADAAPSAQTFETPFVQPELPVADAFVLQDDWSLIAQAA